jgi:acyl carrier protein
VTSWLCQAGVHEGIVPIGRPIANTQIYILDQELQLVPPGVSGEIYLGGAGVARGYLNREELTRERFVQDRFRGKGRLYRTGDLGRWLNDGAIEYLGRNDFQVKIRGFRIELGEIEKRLVGLSGITAAVVIAREDTPGQKRLVAYLTVDTEEFAGSEMERITAIRRQLQSRLPEYMLPSAFLILQKLPLSSNGKLDRKALPAPDMAFTSNVYIAPATVTEIALAQIWADLLKLNPSLISATANLFESGGNSITLIRLATEIRNKFAVELSIRALLENPKLNSLAEQISEAVLKDALAVSSEYKIGSDEMEVTL